MQDAMLDLEARRLAVSFALQENTVPADLISRSTEIYTFLSGGDDE